MVGPRRSQSTGAGSELKSQIHHCKTNKSLECVDPENSHNPVPGASLARITFRHPFRNKHIKKLAKASRNHGTIISRNLDYDTSRIKLPSCLEKIVPSDCRAMIDQVSKEPMLKAEYTNHKYRLDPPMCNYCWPEVNDGHHIYIGPTLGRRALPGRKGVLLRFRRTGRLRRQAAATASKA